MTLSDDLQDISGIGPATAEKVLDVVETHGTAVNADDIDRAIDQARRGNEGAVIDFLESLK